MSERGPSVSFELVVYVVLFTLGAWLRFSQLDRQPLTDAEAREALAALPQPAAFLPADPGPSSPAYQVLTGLAFTFTGPEDRVARWAPAAAGSLLLLAPLLVRRQIGRGAALMTTLLLGISPTLWATARTAGGSAIAALGILTAVLFLARARAEQRGNLERAAGMLGMAAATGHAGLLGLVSLGMGSAGLVAIRRRRGDPNPGRTLALPWPASLAPDTLVRGLFLTGVVALSVASGLGFFVRALGGVFGGLGSWVEGWTVASGIPAASVLLSLPTYEPLLLVFGGLGLVQAVRKGSPLATWLAAWAISAIVLIVVYPGRQPADLLWAVIPLCFLAASEASQVIERTLGAHPLWLVIGFVGAVIALLAFSYLQLAGFVRGPDAFQTLLGLPLLLMLALMGIGLAAAAIGLLGLGWSKQLAGTVAGVAGLILLTSLSLSGGGRLNLAAASARELWRPQASLAGLIDLRATIDTLSKAETGRTAALPLQFSDPSTPALAWVLRGYGPRRAADPAENPPVILRREGSDAEAFASDYLGQSVSIGERWGWTGWWPPDLGSWWLTRDAPTVPDRWVLLVRPDIAGVEQPTLTGEP